MLQSGPAPSRALRDVRLDADLVVTGGGLAGVCAAITAARAGIRVILIQDRPVLGGNASSEVRLWILGATSHMGNNNRWAREGGVTDEILLENQHRNPEGNPLILDTILLEKVVSEPNITLLLNTAVYDVAKRDADTIAWVVAFCSQNSTRYFASAPLFCDASGDGILAFLSGAAFRMGAETREEFGEGFAPASDYGELLGHSLYFYSKDAGKPIQFTPPSFALQDITEIPRFRQIRAFDSGCRFWWLEYGGRRDTVHDTEEIKWELWRVAYGVWNYIKNSGQFPEAANLTLEWVGTIPGKRESRRFEGDAFMIQQDVIEQRPQPDAVSFGGWAIDLHPADGLYSPLSGCTQWHAKGVYAIPYRVMYSRNIANLFLTGRLISVSHVAFGSTRVMATCGHNGQAVGMAAALATRQNLLPRAVPVTELQRELLKSGQFIPGQRLEDPTDLARTATLTATSQLRLGHVPPSSRGIALDASRAMLLPLPAGEVPTFTFPVEAASATTLRAELRTSSRHGNFTPDVTLAVIETELAPGASDLRPAFPVTLPEAGYVFVCLMRNPEVRVAISDLRVTGVLSAAHALNAAVAKGATQQPPEGIGVDTFEFWLPTRRPGGENLALTIEPPLDLFGPGNLTNGIARPTTQPNAWVADPADPAPAVTLTWSAPQTIAQIDLAFDTDFDHPLESVLLGHPERDMPFCVKRYRLRDAAGSVLHECTANHQTLNRIRLPRPVTTTAITVEILETHGAPAALFEVRVYEL